MASLDQSLPVHPSLIRETSWEKELKKYIHDEKICGRTIAGIGAALTVASIAGPCLLLMGLVLFWGPYLGTLKHGGLAIVGVCFASVMPGLLLPVGSSIYPEGEKIVAEAKKLQSIADTTRIEHIHNGAIHRIRNYQFKKGVNPFMSEKAVRIQMEKPAVPASLPADMELQLLAEDESEGFHLCEKITIQGPYVTFPHQNIQASRTIKDRVIQALALSFNNNKIVVDLRNLDEYSRLCVITNLNEDSHLCVITERRERVERIAEEWCTYQQLNTMLQDAAREYFNRYPDHDLTVLVSG